MNEPLTEGNATLVGYRNGTVAIVKWAGGPSPGPNVAWARQSLAPIVWNGQLNPTLNTDPNSPQWGFTLGGVTQVWRTGVGIDRHGNLIFVVAQRQTVISLAQILQHVGAVDAMEFDINPDWHTLITYTHQTRAQPDDGRAPARISPPTATWLPTTAISSPSTGVGRPDHRPVQLGLTAHVFTRAGSPFGPRSPLTTIPKRGPGGPSYVAWHPRHAPV